MIFGKFIEKIDEIVNNAYFCLAPGDRKMKEREELQRLTNRNYVEADPNLHTLNDTLGNELPSARKDKQNFVKGGALDKGIFFFNILNYYMGNTENYGYRRVIFSELNLGGSIIKVLIQIHRFYTKHTKFSFESSLNTDEKEEGIDIDATLWKGTKFPQAYCKALIKSLLVLNYIFIKPSEYNKVFIKENIKDMMKLFKIIMKDGNTKI